jgi:hypothetical protein
MASADRVDLMRLLLRQIDRHPPGAIDGVDLANADPSLVERLLSDRILTEEPPLEDIGPSQRSQDDLPRPIWRRGGETLAFSVEGSAGPERIDPRELVHYPIDIIQLCRAIRNDNQLSGFGPEVLSPRTVLVGWRSAVAGRRAIVLCRLLRNSSAYEDVHMLASRLDSDRLILLTPTERVLGVDISNSLRDRGIEIVPAELALIGAAGRPFALQLEGWRPAVRSDPTVALLVDTRGQRAFFFGHELELRSREFKVLIELARSYANGGYVSRDRLYRVMYPNLGEGDARSYDEQVADAVSRLRAAFKRAAKAAGRSIGKIIESKRKVGYRLAQEIGPVQIQ